MLTVTSDRNVLRLIMASPPLVARIPRRRRIRETREHVADVPRKTPPEPRARAREPAGDRSRRVEAARDPLRPRFELRGRHERGLEDAVLLSLVLRPVCGQDPTVSVETPERRGSRHRHDHAHGRDVHAGLVEELGGTAEDTDVVLVEAEHDPEVHGDPVPMEHDNEPAVVVDTVVRLVRGGEALLRDGLEAHEQRLASALRRELHELLVTRRGGGALARPPLPERRERPEELLRVARARADVVVPEHNRAGRTRGNLADDLVDGTAPVGPRS